MARKRKNIGDLPFEEADSSFAPIPFDTQLKWVNPYLAVEDKQWLQNHRDELPGIVASFLATIETHFVLTTKLDQSSQRWICTLVGKNAQHESGAAALSFRGSSAFNCLAAMAYYVLSLDGEPWWLVAGSTGQGDFD